MKRICRLPDKMVIRTHTKFGRRMDEHSENFNKEKVPNRSYN